MPRAVGSKIDAVQPESGGAPPSAGIARRCLNPAPRTQTFRFRFLYFRPAVRTRVDVLSVMAEGGALHSAEDVDIRSFFPSAPILLAPKVTDCISVSVNLSMISIFLLN